MHFFLKLNLINEYHFCRQQNLLCDHFNVFYFWLNIFYQWSYWYQGIRVAFSYHIIFRYWYIKCIFNSSILCILFFCWAIIIWADILLKSYKHNSFSLLVPVCSWTYCLATINEDIFDQRTPLLNFSKTYQPE